MRFPEFEGEWEEKRLGDCAESLDYGMNSAATKFDGINKYIRITDIDENSSEYISNSPVSPQGELEDKYIVNDNDILFARTGASTGKTYIYKKKDGKLYFAGFLIRARIKREYNASFIFNQTKTVSYEMWVKIMSMRSGQPGINSQEYSNYKFSIPTFNEQQKIASFFSLIDERIQTQSKIIEGLKSHKAAMSKRIFSRNLRFKDENGNEFPKWDYVNGNDIFDNVSDKNQNSDLPILAITQDRGAIPRNLIDYNIIVSDKSIDSYKIVQVGDFIISLRSFQGGIEFSEYNGICSPAYIVLRSKIRINKRFYKYNFKTDDYIKKLNSKLEGIRDGKMVSYKYFSEIQIPLPILEEQTKIANFLSTIDEKIETEKNILQGYKKQKAYFLQQMFI